MDFNIVQSKWSMFHLKDDDDHASIINVLVGTGSPEGVLAYCRSLKEVGNGHFRRHEFNEAYLQYTMAAKVLCFAMPQSNDGKSLFLNLALSLNLNLAACALQSRQFSQALLLCSLALEIDGNNVKGLFRRATAALELGRVSQTYDDLSKASKLDSKNLEISRELDRVKNMVLSNISRECGFHNDVCTVSSAPDRKLGYRDEASSSVSSVVFDQDNNNLLYMGVKGKRSSDVIDAASLKKKKENSSCDYLEGSSSVPMESESSQSLGQPKHNVGCVRELSPPSETSRSFPSASHDMDIDDSVKAGKQHHRFVNSRNHKSHIQVPTKTMGKLASGRELQFYNSACFSFVTIRVVRVVKPILAEVLQDQNSWEAVAPIQCKEVRSLGLQEAHPHLPKTSDQSVLHRFPPLQVVPQATTRSSSSDLNAPPIGLSHMGSHASPGTHFSTRSRSRSRSLSSNDSKSFHHPSLIIRKSGGRKHFPNCFLFCRVKVGCKRRRALFALDDSYDLLQKKMCFDVAFCLFGSPVT